MTRVVPVIPEPDLIFGGGKTEKDPRVGLELHGPFHTEGEPGPSPGSIKVGVIGTPGDCTDARRFLRRLGKPIPSSHANRWLHPDFPGFGRDSPIACEFVTSDTWVSTITNSEIDKLRGIEDVNARIATAANLLRDHVRRLKLEEPGPDVVFCVLPEWIETYCGRSRETRGASTPKISKEAKTRSRHKTLDQWGVVDAIDEAEQDFDLHHALKGKTMSTGLPVQLLRHTTLEGMMRMLDEDVSSLKGRSLQTPAEVAWNICTALYYKAQGRPWRVARLTPGTCYVGIAFYCNKRRADDAIEFSMAQVFTHSLQGFVVRGTEVEVDRHSRQAFMTRSQAGELLARAIAKYTERAGAPPQRIVVHKSSRFSDDERMGVLDATAEIPFDLVAMRPTRTRFLRPGSYPVLRGTCIPLSRNEALLYTTGYVPRLRTYPGARIPEPLHLFHDGVSEVEFIAREIMGLTKLDWNTTAFSTTEPITIGFARRVGDVLSELEDDSVAQDHYRFYM